MTMDAQKTGPEKSGRGLRIALAISVAFNLAVVGLVAGAMLRDGPGMRPPMVRELGFGPYTEALAPADRKALRQALLERAPEIRQARLVMRDDTEALLALLRADPFDTAAFEARMAAQHARMEKQLRLGQDLLQEFIAAMPAENRRAFADRLEAGLRRGDKHRDRKEGEAAPDPSKG